MPTRFLFGLPLLMLVFASGARADSAVAWGHNAEGEVGIGVRTSPQLTPVIVSGLSSGVTAIAAGDSDGFAIQNGALYAWGSNIDGELGDGTTTERDSPVAVSGLTSGVTAVAGGLYHSLAVQNGGVFAWGHGELGDGTTDDSNVPVAVSGLTSGVTAVAASGYDSFALQNGGVYAWGSNDNGDLGDGTRVNRLTPGPVLGLTSGVTAIATGNSHYLAIQNGALYTWGLNYYGALGDGTTNPRTVALAVTGLTSCVTAAAGGFYHSLAVQNGHVFAWGTNSQGQLGDGTTTQHLTPEQIDSNDLKNIVAVAADFESSYALSSDGSLWDWGYNANGQLGLGNNYIANYLTPQHLLPPAGYLFSSIDADANGFNAVATLATLAEFNSNLVPGDFNRDRHFDAADIQPMEQALTNLATYQATYDLTAAQLLTVGDINKDGAINNTDLQALLNLLQTGGGSTNPVPEPSTIVLAVLAALMVGLFRRS